MRSVEISSMHILEYSKMGWLTSLRNAITYDVSLDDVDAYGRTALMWAIIKNQVSCVNLLIGSGCEINKLDSYGNDAMCYALRAGNQELVKLLYENGARVDAVTSSGLGHLSWAIRYCKFATVEFLLEHHAVYAAHDTSGRNLLMLAASLSKKKVVDLLIDWGVDPRCKTNLGLTAADYALAADDPELADYLDDLCEEFDLDEEDRASSVASDEEVVPDRDFPGSSRFLYDIDIMALLQERSGASYWR